jgi:hypothetical protein
MINGEETIHGILASSKKGIQGLKHVQREWFFTGAMYGPSIALYKLLTDVRVEMHVLLLDWKVVGDDTWLFGKNCNTARCSSGVVKKTLATKRPLAGARKRVPLANRRQVRANKINGNLLSNQGSRLRLGDSI